ncbi:protein PRRC1-like [Macrosteles quadrilineatus]|uniref:protein PRRC1-like n=1 Tax=Macrosteles quadrilineatus TaxID=74068 RepID=UPI0023E24D86|nr:protein PRRC1-like [Macrosteles quadrilineatus]
MQDDSSNSESTFEFVDSKNGTKAQSAKQQKSTDADTEKNVLSAVEPPSALPSFVPPVVLSEPSASSPLAFHPTTFSPVIPAEKGLPVSSPSADSAAEASPSTDTSTGLLGWVRGYNPGQLLNKVAEKAKSSVDTVITTLDPQMRDLGLLSSGKGDFEVIVASDKEVKISPVREAFQSIFGSRVAVKGLAADARGLASQPVGFEAGLRGAWLRVEAIRALYPEGPIVAVENFLVQIAPERWFDVGALVLSDIGRGVALESFTQMTPVPTAIVTMAQEETSEDEQKTSMGFKIPIGSLMASNLHVHPSEWHQAMTGVSRREMILLAARSLVNIYKNSLL